MNCLECRGACCEDILLPVGLGDSERVREWLAARGTIIRSGWHAVYSAIEARCPHLDPTGRCSIYERRPAICREYEPGGYDCLETVARRRPATSATCPIPADTIAPSAVKAVTGILAPVAQLDRAPGFEPDDSQPLPPLLPPLPAEPPVTR